jgi:hypothetical protein
VDVIVVRLPSSFAPDNIAGLYDWLWELQLGAKDS